jgi:hypothetical protein
VASASSIIAEEIGSSSSKINKPQPTNTASPTTNSSIVASVSASAVVKISVEKVNNEAQTSRPVKPSKEEKERGRTENSLAAIMMGYVLVFLICHSPRLLLNLHELTTIRYCTVL